MPNTRVTHIKSGADADFKLEYDTIYVYDEVNNQLTTVADLSSEPTYVMQMCQLHY